MNRLLLYGVILAGILVGTSCSDGENSKEMRMCEETAQTSPAILLVGTEGTAEICQCTVDSVATRVPNAAEKWTAFGEELQSRMDRRGIVGFMVDSSWNNSKGQEMASFARIQGEVLAFCTEKMLKEWGSPLKN